MEMDPSMERRAFPSDAEDLARIAALDREVKRLEHAIAEAIAALTPFWHAREGAYDTLERKYRRLEQREQEARAILGDWVYQRIFTYPVDAEGADYAKLVTRARRWLNDEPPDG
jgi:hypothetical protein